MTARVSCIPALNPPPGPIDEFEASCVINDLIKYASSLKRDVGDLVAVVTGAFKELLEIKIFEEQLEAVEKQRPWTIKPVPRLTGLESLNYRWGFPDPELTAEEREWMDRLAEARLILEQHRPKVESFERHIEPCRGTLSTLHDFLIELDDLDARWEELWRIWEQDATKRPDSTFAREACKTFNRLGVIGRTYNDELAKINAFRRGVENDSLLRVDPPEVEWSRFALHIIPIIGDVIQGMEAATGFTIWGRRLSRAEQIELFIGLVAVGALEGIVLLNRLRRLDRNARGVRRLFREMHEVVDARKGTTVAEDVGLHGLLKEVGPKSTAEIRRMVREMPKYPGLPADLKAVLERLKKLGDGETLDPNDSAKIAEALNWLYSGELSRVARRHARGGTRFIPSASEVVSRRQGFHSRGVRGPLDAALGDGWKPEERAVAEAIRRYESGEVAARRTTHRYVYQGPEKKLQQQRLKNPDLAIDLAQGLGAAQRLRRWYVRGTHGSVGSADIFELPDRAFRAADELAEDRVYDFFKRKRWGTPASSTFDYPEPGTDAYKLLAREAETERFLWKIMGSDKKRMQAANLVVDLRASKIRKGPADLEWLFDETRRIMDQPWSGYERVLFVDDVAGVPEVIGDVWRLLTIKEQLGLASESVMRAAAQMTRSRHILDATLNPQGDSPRD